MSSIIYVIYEKLTDYKSPYKSPLVGEAYTDEQNTVERVNALTMQHKADGREFFYGPLDLDKYVPLPFIVKFDTRALSWTAVHTAAIKPPEPIGYPDREKFPFWVWPCIYATTRYDAIRKAKEFTIKIMELKL